MQCGAPFCKNTSGAASTESAGISFHAFPSEVGLRAAWLRALGKQDSLLPDSAVVCSQHFLDDDICETESGLRQLATGAVPSTVQVCMICLHTDSRLVLMSKYKMEEAYEKLTGYPPCDVGNLKQALCIECAHRLRTFSQFRDKSLRARAILMDLVEKHELITRRHIKMINRTKNQLDHNFVMTTLGPDPCDLYIQEHPSEEQRTDSEATLQTVEVKKEDSYDSMSVDVDMAVENDDSNAECLNELNDEFVAPKEEYLNETNDLFKHEIALFQCSLCYEQFESESVCERHMDMHGQADVGDGERAASAACEARTAASSSCPDTSLRYHQPAVAPFLATNNGNKVRAEEADTVQRRRQVFIMNNEELDNQSFDTNSVTNINRLTNCVVKLYDVFKQSNQCVQIQDGSLITQRAAGPCASQRHIDTDSRDLNREVASQNEDIGIFMKKENVNSSTFSENFQIEPCCSSNYQVTLPSKTHFSNTDINESTSFVGNNKFTCDFCRNVFERKNLLVKHVKTHTEMKPFTCKFCKKTFRYKSLLTNHLRTHTGKKLQSCKLCKYKAAHNSALVSHMRIHTGEKPYSCELCDYSSAYKSALVTHMRTHTGEKPYSCKLCKHKTANKSHLVKHMRTHSGEKPYSCKLCKYKTTVNGALVRHMRTHTGEKPHSCKLCKYKTAYKSNLVKHMRNHTGEKPYSCELCDYSCANKSALVTHMRTHTGEKPYSCKLCKYKTGVKSHLVSHIRTHTGEKPYSCKLCKYKAAQNSSLVIHMRTHTGEKPHSCKLCKYKTADKSHLVKHMRTHTGEKPYSCDLCDYSCAHKSVLVTHMRTHTGEKPYSCKLCKYKTGDKSHLVSHMRTHTGEKPYSCKLCEYKAAHNSRLVIHMRTHTGEKPFCCQLCKFKAANNSSLVIHMRTHTGEKPYCCECCKYKCASRNTLVKHMRTHTGEKPYSCKLCEYKAANVSNLVIHMRTHTGEKPFCCQLCKFKAAHNSSLVRHMRTHTGE